MKNISAIIIARNGQSLLSTCIESLRFCDEILVVDGESTDNTVSVAKKLGAKILHGAANNFAKQRNIGLRAATGTWVLYVDTDERVTQELQQSICTAISSDVYAAYKVKRENYYLGTHVWPKTETMERLFKKDALQKWEGTLHESPEFIGRIGLLDGYLLHFTHKDLFSMLEKTNEWSATEAKLRFDSNHPTMNRWRFYRVMITSFSDSYFSQQGWRAGTAGLIESMYQSFSSFCTYAKLWELQQRKP